MQILYTYFSKIYFLFYHEENKNYFKLKFVSDIIQFINFRWILNPPTSKVNQNQNFRFWIKINHFCFLIYIP